MKGGLRSASRSPPQKLDDVLVDQEGPDEQRHDDWDLPGV
jgi:hypothetical protein